MSAGARHACKAIECIQTDQLLILCTCTSVTYSRWPRRDRYSASAAPSSHTCAHHSARASVRTIIIVTLLLAAPDRRLSSTSLLQCSLARSLVRLLGSNFCRCLSNLIKVVWRHSCTRAAA